MDLTEVELADTLLNPFVEFWAYYPDTNQELTEKALHFNIMNNKENAICPLRTENGTLYAVIDFGRQQSCTPREWYEEIKYSGIFTLWNRLLNRTNKKLLSLMKECKTAENSPDYQKAKNKWLKSRKILKDMEIKYSIEWPAEVFNFFERERYCGAFIIPTPSQFSEVDFEIHPMRFFTIAHCLDGNSFGIWCNKQHGMIASFTTIGGGRITPITNDFKQFFNYLENGPYFDHELMSKLNMSTNSKHAELEFLKPFIVEDNYDWMTTEWYDNREPWPKEKIEELINKFSQEDPISEMIQKIFTDYESIFILANWHELTLELMKSGFKEEGIRAFENAIELPNLHYKFKFQENVSQESLDQIKAFIIPIVDKMDYEWYEKNNYVFEKPEIIVINDSSEVDPFGDSDPFADPNFPNG